MYGGDTNTIAIPIYRVLSYPAITKDRLITHSVEKTRQATLAVLTNITYIHIYTSIRTYTRT